MLTALFQSIPTAEAHRRRNPRVNQQHHADVFEDLAHCESGHRNDLGSPYWGYFQFSPRTWTGLALPGLPSDHSYEEQLDAARRLVQRSGWGQFPACSRSINARARTT